MKHIRECPKRIFNQVRGFIPHLIAQLRQEYDDAMADAIPANRKRCPSCDSVWVFKQGAEWLCDWCGHRFCGCAGS